MPVPEGVPAHRVRKRFAAASLKVAAFSAHPTALAGEGPRAKLTGGTSMARAFRAIFFSFILLSSFAPRGTAGPLEDASAALERRDFAIAVRLLRPLADRGNAEAQMKLGFMHIAGEGIPQD